MVETPPVGGVSDIILITEAGYASDDHLKVHAQFQVAEEETNRPREGLTQRLSQRRHHHIARPQYAGTDGANPEIPAITVQSSKCI